MKITKINELEKVVEFEVALDEKEWVAAQDKSLKILAKNYKVPGFRPGAAPIDMLKNKINPAEIMQHAVNKYLSDISKFITESKEFDDSSALESIVSNDVITVSPTALKVKIGFEAVPKIEKFDLKQIKLPVYQPIKADERFLAQQIKMMLKNEIMLLPKQNAKIVNGDVAIIDFKGFIDNIPFAGGEAKNYELEIGSKTFIPGFEDQLIGHKVKDKFDVKVSFPSDYHVKDLANKPVKFEVTIHDIKTMQIPEITSKTLEKIGLVQLKNKKDLENYLADLYLKEQRAEYLKTSVETINKIITDKIKVSYYPNSLISLYKNQLVKQYENQARNEKISFDEFLLKNKVSREQFGQFIDENARTNLVIALVYDQLMETLKIEIEDHDVKLHLEDLTKYFNDEKKAKEMYEANKDYNEAIILKNKLIDKIVDACAKETKKVAVKK